MEQTIVVKNISTYAMFDTDGVKLREQILAAWAQGTTLVTLDFQGIELFATMFFNASIGWLILYKNPDYVSKHLQCINLSSLGKETYQHSYKNALMVKEDPSYRKALAEFSEEE